MSEKDELRRPGDPIKSREDFENLLDNLNDEERQAFENLLDSPIGFVDQIDDHDGPTTVRELLERFLEIVERGRDA